MSSDDSDPDEGADAETSRAESDGPRGGQPRDPETGQFLPKDRPSDRADDAEGESLASSAESERDSGASDRPPVRGRGADPDTAGEHGLRLVGVRIGDTGGGPTGAVSVSRRPERSVSVSSRTLLPPSLHLVPMQVQRTGEVVTVDAAPAGPRPSGRFDV